MESLNTCTHGRVVATTGHAVRQMSGEAAQFPGGRDQPIPIVAMAFQELVAAHNGEMYRPGDGVFPAAGFFRES